MPKEQTPPEGENYKPISIIRPVNISDPEEMERVKRIENDPSRLRWFYNDPSTFHQTDEELLKLLTTDNSSNHVFAVTGDPKRKDIADLGETGKLQGLVYINPESDFRISELKKVLPGISASTFLEISYAKLEGALGGQMGRGVREVCALLAKQLCPDGDTAKLCINAYIMTDERGTNEPSVHLLDSSGFIESKSIFYEPENKFEDRLFILNWSKLQALL